MSEPITEFRGCYRFLSNFWLCGIELDGVVYPSVEHAYQAAKTLNAEERATILDCKRPGEAKYKGRHVTMRKDWDKIKIGVMRDLLRKKFRIPYLRQKLADTGRAELIEGNYWGDVFWGVCNGVGENHLGKLLMEVRKEIVP
jgi:N-glycosidase YbiA